MSVYFIHAEAVLHNGCTAEKIGRIIVASDAISALKGFLVTLMLLNSPVKELTLSLTNSKR